MTPSSILHRLVPHPLPTLVLSLLLQTGCAANTPQQAMAEKTGPYYQDAQLCRAKSPLKPVPAGADPAVSLDSAAYLKCMSQFGYQQEAKTDPLLVALKTCQQQGTRTVSASGATQTRPPRPTDVRACLQQRGFPSTGFPPPPAGSPPTPATPAGGGGKLMLRQPPAPRGTTPDRERVQTIYIPPRTTPAQP